MGHVVQSHRQRGTTREGVYVPLAISPRSRTSHHSSGECLIRACPSVMMFLTLSDPGPAVSGVALCSAHLLSAGPSESIRAFGAVAGRVRRGDGSKTCTRAMWRMVKHRPDKELRDAVRAEQKYTRPRRLLHRSPVRLQRPHQGVALRQSCITAVVVLPCWHASARSELTGIRPSGEGVVS